MKYTDIWGDELDMEFIRTHYIDNGRPAIVAVCDGEEYAVVTVNIFAPLTALDGYRVHADTNNCERLVEEMCEQGYMTKTGLVGQSGFCEYPEVELNREWFDSLPSYE